MAERPDDTDGYKWNFTLWLYLFIKAVLAEKGLFRRIMKKQKSSKTIYRLFLGLLFLSALLIIWREPVCRALGRFLVVADDLKKADVIVVLSGDDERVGHAVALYKQGLADYMIMSGGLSSVPSTMAANMKRQARGMGVPAEHILLESQSLHTYQHPLLVAPLLRENGFTSAIIVSSPYHMRRVAMLFDRTFKRSGVKLMYCPVTDSWFNPDIWWQSPAGRRVVRLEYMKMFVNVFGKNINDLASRLTSDHKN